MSNLGNYYAARRTVIEQLRNEGLDAEQIAAQLQLSPDLINADLEALEKRRVKPRKSISSVVFSLNRQRHTEPTTATAQQHDVAGLLRISIHTP